MARLGIRGRLTLWFAVAVLVALVAFGAAVLAVLVVDANEEHREQLARNIEPYEDPFDLVVRVLVAMGLAVPLGAGAAAVIGWLVARRAVFPLKDAAQRARIARASELDLVLPVGGRGDEWDELAMTLNALLADARRSMEQTRRFTADAAHELRTPLTAMMGEAEVALRRHRTPEELRHSLEEVHAESVRLHRLVESLLLLARADAGALLWARVPVDVRELMGAAIDRARRQAAGGPQRDVRIDLVQPEHPAPRFALVEGDPDPLARAIGNVLDNAVRHARSSVSVSLEVAEEAVRLRIWDDGAGLSPELASRVFDRFVRGDPVRSGEGTGLGLPIARAITEAHGGRLTIDQPSPATFVFMLPMSRQG